MHRRPPPADPPARGAVARSFPQTGPSPSAEPATAPPRQRVDYVRIPYVRFPRFQTRYVSVRYVRMLG